MTDPLAAPAPIEIAAAVIVDPARGVLVARRRAGAHLEGLHEFPGGKVRPGEAPEAACARECREEIGVEVEVLSLALPRAVHRYADRSVALSFFLCRLAPGSPEPRALETGEVRWVAPGDLGALNWPEANRELVARLASAVVG